MFYRSKKPGHLQLIKPASPLLGYNLISSKLSTQQRAPHNIERCLCGLFLNLLPVSAELPPQGNNLSVGGQPEIDGSNRFFSTAAAWAGNTGNGDGKVDLSGEPRTRCHGLRGHFAHRAMLLEKVMIHPEQPDFHIITIGDKTTDKKFRNSRYPSQPVRDEPAATRFCHGQRFSLFCQKAANNCF